MKRPLLAEYSLPVEGWRFGVRYARLADAQRFLSFSADYAEPHRRKLFRPDDPDAVESLRANLKKLQPLAEWEPGGIYHNGQLTIARYAVGSYMTHPGDEGVMVGAAKINARYPYDQLPFIAAEDAEAMRPPKWLRRLGAKTAPLKDNNGRLQQEVFELSANHSAVPQVEAMTLLPLVERLPAETEVRATVDIGDKEAVDMWMQEFGAELIGETAKLQDRGRNVIQMLAYAGALTSQLEMNLERNGIGRFVGAGK